MAVVCKWNHMLVVFDTYLSTWKHSLHVSYFIPLILFHELAIFHREAKKRQILLVAPQGEVIRYRL